MQASYKHIFYIVNNNSSNLEYIVFLTVFTGVFCDFEGPCNWTTPATPDGLPGWQRSMGHTPTPNTGPSGGYSEAGTDGKSNLHNNSVSTVA